MSKIFTEQDAKEALLKLKEVKGFERAQLIEQVLRNETDHFRSYQYRMCGSAGMEYGKWADLDESQFTTINIKDNKLTGAKQMRTFIRWNDVYDFCIYFSNYIDRHNGNYARWNRTTATGQAEYRKRIGTVKPRFIV